mgnify:CR=1 FL=1
METRFRQFSTPPMPVGRRAAPSNSCSVTLVAVLLCIHAEANAIVPLPRAQLRVRDRSAQSASAVTRARSPARPSIEIPIGVNRCWVKTVEKGTFPHTQRFFFPVLCNQCDDAPCMQICPTNALFKRRDGIVDLHGDSCIGCRACMVGVPVRSAVHRSEHAHRREMQLLREPRRERAAAGVRQRLPDRMPHLRRPRRSSERGRADRAAASGVDVRKPEKGTIPKVFYLGAERTAIQPETRGAPVHLQGRPGAAAAARRRPSPIRAGPATRASTTTRRTSSRGASTWRCYLLTKGIATGTMLVSLLLPSLSTAIACR